MKKLLTMLGSGLASVVALAEEPGTASGIVSIDDVQAIFTGAQSSMTSLIDAALPVIIAFVGGGLIIWGAIALVGVIKRAFGAGKGR